MAAGGGSPGMAIPGRLWNAIRGLLRSRGARVGRSIFIRKENRPELRPVHELNRHHHNEQKSDHNHEAGSVPLRGALSAPGRPFWPRHDYDPRFDLCNRLDFTGYPRGHATDVIARPAGAGYNREQGRWTTIVPNLCEPRTFGGGSLFWLRPRRTGRAGAIWTLVGFRIACATRRRDSAWCTGRAPI